jgi:hypothetical protein
MNYDQSEGILKAFYHKNNISENFGKDNQISKRLLRNLPYNDIWICNKS